MSKNINFLEKDLETILFEAPQEEISKRGLSCFRHENIYRQITLGNYGFADIITNSFYQQSPEDMMHITITIYELKNLKVDLSALAQIARYIKGVKRLTRELGNKENIALHVSGVLIGRSLELNGDFVFLLDMMEDIECYTYAFDYRGISFCKQSGFTMSKEGDSDFNGLLDLDASTYTFELKKKLYGSNERSDLEEYELEEIVEEDDNINEEANGTEYSF